MLSGWTVALGNPVYLSLFAGSGQNHTGLDVRDCINGNRSQFPANALAYHETFGGLTAMALNDFAVTGATPIPSALLQVGPELAGPAYVRRRILAWENGFSWWECNPQ